MSLRNPLTPPDEKELVKFAQSVNRGNVPFAKELVATFKSVRKAVGNVLGDTVGIATVPIESALNAAGWIGGAFSGTAYKTSHLLGSTRRKAKHIVGGFEQNQGQAA